MMVEFVWWRANLTPIAWPCACRMNLYWRLQRGLGRISVTNTA